MSTNPNQQQQQQQQLHLHQQHAAAAAAATTATCQRERGKGRESSYSNSQRNLLEFLCICVACIVCYYNSTQCGLVFDDISAIRDNKDLRPSTPLRNVFLNDFWGTPMRKEQSHKSYRPLTVLTFRFNYLLHALEPFGYHLVNLLLHIAVCLLWRRVCRLLLRQCGNAAASNEAPSSSSSSSSSSSHNTCAFVASLLFATHPVHTEAVTGVVGRAELLSSICYLGAFLSYAHATSSSTRRTNWTSLFLCFASCLLASMLCKEQGITVAAICAVYELFVVQQLRPLHLFHFVLRLFEEQPQAKAAAAAATSSSTRRWSSTIWKRLGFLMSITIALLVGRVYVMGSQLPIFTRFDNPASSAPTPVRQLTYGYLIYLNSWLLLCPSLLCCDWTMGECVHTF